MHPDYYRFIADEVEMKWFYDYAVPNIFEDNVLFMSLSARNKLLTKEEREKYQLSRSEMMRKTVIRKNGFKYLLETIRSLECNKEGMLTKAGLPYPDKALRVYWNLNTTSCMKVLYEQRKLVDEHTQELIAAALKRSDVAIDSAYHKIRKIFDSTLSLYAKSCGKKMWMDFEIDLDGFYSESQKDDFLELTSSRLIELLGRGNFLVISSPSGFHFPVKRSAVKFPPNVIVYMIKTTAEQMKIAVSECTRNENEMVCLPSTYAYDSRGNKCIIRVLNKGDFSEKDKIIKLE